MTLHRRAFLRLTAGAAGLSIAPRFARAQAYPTKQVRLMVGFAAGSSSDILMRLIGQRLADRLGQPFIIENRGGAGGNLATEAVTRAEPDGYTLLNCGTWDTINATLYKKLSFNFVRDIIPVASISRGPNVLVVHPSFPAKTVQEFVAYAKANPGKVNFASAGIGTTAHMAGELFKAMAGVNLVHVPYKGLAPAMNDLLGGQVQAIFSTMPPAVAHIRSGSLHGLAVTSAVRSDTLPDLPTIADFIPGYESTLLTGLGAPKGTPREIVERLNAEINSALADPVMKARLSDLGNVPAPTTPAGFGQVLADELEKWGKVIRMAGIEV
jgi:tripartite-type tricarboxylate transporter receptor subunit TctC